jgi:hypothetical protein
MISLRVALTALLVFVSDASAQALAAVARVSSVAGSALLAGADGSALPLARGYLLNPGDRIDTRTGGRVVIDLSDGSMVVVQPGTLLSIKDFRAAASVRELFEIAIGAVRVKIHHLTGKPNPYRMNSPTASIAVRGTEFDVIVSDNAETKVAVFEGAVEVGSLTDPEDKALIEAGGTVLVRPGQPLQFLGAPIARAAPPRLRRPGPSTPPERHVAHAPAMARPSPGGHAGPGSRKEISRTSAPPRPAATPPAAVDTVPGASDRYLASLTSVDYLPLTARFSAFADLHADSLENPAYAAGVRTSEGRAFLAPAYSGSEFSVMPQASLFARVGGALVLGGSIAAARLDGTNSPGTAFTSATALAATAFGRSAAGVSVEQVSGTGSSRVRQLRFTAGLRRDLGGGHQAGVFGRYGTLGTSSVRSFAELMQSHRQTTTGATWEAGVRIRGPLAAKLWYGAVASVDMLSLSAGDLSSALRGTARRGSLTFGVGHAPNARTLLSFDITGGASVRAERAGLLRLSSADSRFFSVHAGIQRDVHRRLYLAGSFVNTWRSDASEFFLSADRFGRKTAVPEPLFPGWDASLGRRYAEFGARWRLTRGVSMQYSASLFGGGLRPGHTVALRYSFRAGE